MCSAILCEGYLVPFADRWFVAGWCGVELGLISTSQSLPLC
jgi:hypothetical protein